MANPYVDESGNPIASYPAPPGTTGPASPSDFRSVTSGEQDDVDSFVNRYQAKTDALGEKLGGIEQQRGAAEQKAGSSVDAKMERDAAQMRKAYGAEAAAPDAIPPPWNADAEQKARVKTPIEDFGSIGSIFAIIASAFTKQPMVSALNASAAAMTAIRNHDEEGYKTAYQAWKDNTELAVKRFDMEHSLYQDANKLLDTDVTQWKVKQLQIAAQFDNQKTVAMLEAGADQQLLAAQDAQLSARDKMIQIMQRQQTFDQNRTELKTRFAENDKVNPDSPQDATKQQKMQFYKEHPGSQPNHKALWRIDAVGLQAAEQKGNLAMQELFKFRMDKEATGHTPTADEESEFMKSHQLGVHGVIGGAGSTLTKAEGSLEEDLFNEKVAKGKDVVTARKEAIAEAKAAGVTISGNKAFDVKREEAQYDESLKTLDDSIQFLNDYVGGAGIAGRATRGAERIEDIAGSNKTARVQFMRNIEYLQGAAQKLLFDRNGRPLSRNAEQIDEIIGGLSFGDTTANTRRSLEEVKQRYQRLKQDLQNQLSNQPATPKTDGAAKPSGTPAWQEAPITQPATQ